MIIPKPLTYRQWKHPEESDETGVFNNIVFPLIRRVAARAMANDLVAVQPLDVPRGDLLFFDDNFIDTRTIIDRIPKPIPYKNWKRRKSITKKWEDAGFLDGLECHVNHTTGLVFVPYIPLQITPAIIEGNIEPREGIATRYTRRMIDNRFYGVIGVNPHND